MVRTLLVANRGEIARRVMRTARQMGIQTVAVYSEPDAAAPFVAEADIAVPLGGTTSAESYLDVTKILDAAKRSGADAIHPGYGFLAENTAFAQACEAGGITFVGPPPGVIASMALKVEAKAIAAEAGLPLLPGGSESEADSVGFPLLVKASAGGGGKGMRLVRTADELPAAVEGAKREAQSSFGDPTVFLERYVEAPRHVEVQVFADTHGNVVHLYERECSIQRRHQKVVEESPSPGIDDTTRRRMGEAAVALAERIGYVGAGTVEFLVDATSGEFYFLEMNTRLQVEHPVTEGITGLDLVRLQLQVASGEPLGFTQDDVTATGHAIEVRLYAEDPAADFMPCVGTLHRYAHGPTPGIRYDDGVTSGSEVSPFYDPMLSKVVAHAPTRAEAAARLARALDELEVHGLRTNKDFLAATLRHEAFLAGLTFTDFVERHPEVLDAGPSGEERLLAAVAATLVAAHDRQRQARVLGFAPVGWRNVRSQPQVASYEGVDVPYTVHGDRFEAGDCRGRIIESGPCSAELEVDGIRYRFAVRAYGEAHYVNTSSGQVELIELPRFKDHSQEAAGGGPMAPVPGTVVAVEVAAGDRVEAGQTLVVMEAMKMEHRIVAGEDATVLEVLVGVGEQVDAHQVLVTLEEVEA